MQNRFLVAALLLAIIFVSVEGDRCLDYKANAQASRSYDVRAQPLSDAYEMDSVYYRDNMRMVCKTTGDYMGGSYNWVLVCVSDDCCVSGYYPEEYINCPGSGCGDYYDLPDCGYWECYHDEHDAIDVTSSDVNIHTQPSVGSKVIEALDRGTSLELLCYVNNGDEVNDNNDWLKVCTTFDCCVAGYVPDQYVSCGGQLCKNQHSYLSEC